MAPRRAKLPKLSFGSDSQRVEARLREAILYVAFRCESAERFGKTKLNKILAFADFAAFARRGESITNSQYMRQPKGPVPRNMTPLLDKMVQSREIAFKKVQVDLYVEERVIALRKADVSIFSAQDIAILEDVIRLAWKSTGTQLSDFSHGRAWQVAKKSGTLIPYEAVFLSDRPVSEADIARARELNRKYRWVDVAT